MVSVDGRWIVGMACKCIKLDVFFTEVLAISTGLSSAIHICLPEVQLYTDFLEAVRLIRVADYPFQHYAGLIMEIRKILDTKPSFSIDL